MGRILTMTEALTLQRALNANGARLDLDGHFGAISQTALIDYQRRNGLFPSGNPDLPTTTKLGIPAIETIILPSPKPPSTITLGSLLPILIPLLTKGVPMTIPDIAGWLNSSVILGFLRNILISAGGVMTTTGLFTGAQWEQIVGVIIMIVSAILSALANKKAADAKEIAKAVEIHPALTIVPKTDGTAAIAVN